MVYFAAKKESKSGEIISIQKDSVGILVQNSTIVSVARSLLDDAYQTFSDNGRKGLPILIISDTLEDASQENVENWTASLISHWHDVVLLVSCLVKFGI